MSLKIEHHPVKFGSLDVVNLYGSIPLESSCEIPSVVDAAVNFFQKFRQFSTFSQLSLPDFRRLINISLNEDRYILNGDIF